MGPAMSAKNVSQALDRYTEIGALGAKVQEAVKKTLLPFAVALAVEAADSATSPDSPGADAFLLICLGTCVSLKIWSSGALGLPLLPLMIVQSLIIYGVPIAVGHEIIKTYPPGPLSSVSVRY